MSVIASPPTFSPDRADGALPDPTRTTSDGAPTEGISPAPERWVCLEIFGHRQHYGRLTRVQEFGAEFARVEELCPRGHLLRPPVQYPGAAIFSLTDIPEMEAKRYADQYVNCPHADCKAERAQRLALAPPVEEEGETGADLFDDFGDKEMPE